MQATDRHLEPHQARTRAPTSYEDLLGDALERAFGQGIHDLPGLVGYLNQTGPASPGGQPWTEDNYQAHIGRLGL